MDKVRFTSAQLKIWEDKLIKLKSKKTLQHLDSIKIQDIEEHKLIAHADSDLIDSMNQSSSQANTLNR